MHQMMLWRAAYQLFLSLTCFLLCHPAAEYQRESKSGAFQLATQKLRWFLWERKILWKKSESWSILPQRILTTVLHNQTTGRHSASWFAGFEVSKFPVYRVLRFDLPYPLTDNSYQNWEISRSRLHELTVIWSFFFCVGFVGQKSTIRHISVLSELGNGDSGRTIRYFALSHHIRVARML